jgi:lipooligosaccharide transport system permease protein
MRRASAGFWFGVWRVAERNLRVWRRFAGASTLGNFGEPLLYLLALGYGLGSIMPRVEGMSYAEFIAPGLVVSTVMYTATFEGTFGSYTRLETQRTFDAILATPITIGELVAGEVLWGGLKASFGAAIVLSVIRLFGLVGSWSALWVIPLGFAAGIMFTAMALVVTALSESYESFNYYFTLVVAPMFLFSGIFFPLQQLPGWVDHVSHLLPLTHAVELARGCVRGTAGVGELWHLGAIVAFTVVAYTACRVLLVRRLRV